jgi:hypothetical protein
MGIVLSDPTQCRNRQQREEDAVKLDIRDKTEVWVVGKRVPVIGPDGKQMMDINGKLVNWYEYITIAAAVGNMSAEEVALEVCHTRGDVDFFIGPLPVNVIFPSERVEWAGQYYPLREEQAAREALDAALTVREGVVTAREEEVTVREDAQSNGE